MPFARSTTWSVACDREGCAAQYEDPDGVLLVFGSEQEAVDAAREMDWDVVTADEPAYCEKHAGMRCTYCDDRDEHMVLNDADEPVCRSCAA